MRSRAAVTLAALLLVAVPACSLGGDDEEGARTTTAGPATPDSVKTAVYERSYSDCYSFTVAELASQHAVDPTEQAVTRAVAAAWAQRFGGGDDAVRSGEDGCKLGFQQKRAGQ